MKRPLVIDLANLGPDDRRRVGAKAWRLGQLLRAGFPVPPGFCLTAAACAEWGPESRRRLLAAYRALGSGPVAVRSSALEEDGEGASYAGIYGSELPVDGEAALFAAVEHCLASWHGPAAREYRQRLGGGGEFALALLVQRLVPAIAAGVAYTCDPLRPRSRRIHINAVWGLAEPLAAGRVAADSFVLSRRGRLLAREVAEKPGQLTPTGPAGVPAANRSAPCLTPAQARRVAALAMAAESHFGAPQDVEFALAADSAWIVQSRPVVAPPADPALPLERYLRREQRRLERRFAALRRRGILKGREGVLSNGNVGELLPTPTPMSFGLFRQLFCGPRGAVVAGRQRLGYRFAPRITAHLYEKVAGQVYFNLEVDAATFDCGASPPVDVYLDRVAADPSLANYPEVHLYRQRCTPGEGDRGAADTLEAFHRRLRQAAVAFAARPDLRHLPSPPSDPGWGRLSAAATAAAAGERIRELRAGPCVDFVMAARLGFHFAARVRERLVAWLGNEGEALCAPLFSGLPGSLATQEALDLEALLAGTLDREGFLAAYGHGADNELEISLPRLHESPARLAAMVRHLAASGRSPAADFDRQRRHRREAEAALAIRLEAAGIPAGERAKLATDLAHAQRLLPLRETFKVRYTAGYADIRQGLLHFAHRLGWEESLVFHLEPRELGRAAAAPERWRKVAEGRREERELAREAARAGRLPNVIFASRLEAIGRQPAATGGGVWRGSGLAPGRAWGIARVVDDDARLAEAELTGEDILVLRSANLGLAPLFRLVAGVVVEVGGLLAHSACQAREAGIPAVLLPGATGLIADGARICLDGAAGSVAILSSQPASGCHDLAAV